MISLHSILLSASAQYSIWNFGVVIDRSALITHYPRHHSGGKLLLYSPRNDCVVSVGSGVLAVFVAWWVKIRVRHRGGTLARGDAPAFNIAVSWRC